MNGYRENRFCGYEGEYVRKRKRNRRNDTSSVRAARRKKRRRLRRILLCAEVMAAACFLYLLFGALPSLIGNAQETQRMNGYGTSRFLPETGESTGRLTEYLLHLGAGAKEEKEGAYEGQQTFNDTAGGKGVVVLDAGHGGKDVGCMRGDTYEKDINLAIAYLTKDALQRKGYDVVMVRTDDTFYELYERAACANRYEGRNDSVFVSIHVNAMEDDSMVSGIECYANRAANALSPDLAKSVAEGVSGMTGARLRKTEEESDLYVVSHALIPACLIEVGFLSSDTEYAYLTDASYRADIAAGIAEGVDAYFTAEHAD